uniref:Putative reverse transcriptase, RNA-dependent DNA polymerase n=1 Tax=Tanacetum cinerariifolium TaxID=118510 RepID=A0A6L2K345_TANCI|nr:putative reverse transcriptase, RNA-dependent DNA polymerase [Tanacetum cinerariifolium]
MVRKEVAHQIILGVTNETHGIATGLIVEETDGMGLSTKGFRIFDGQKKPATRDDKSHLKCEKCGMNRHTKDQCFKIIGYPDWWIDGYKTASNKGAKKYKPSTSPTANTRTGQIIGRGTKKDGLYYIDEVVQSSTVMLAHGTIEREGWFWHRRLGHPSVSYLHTLFSDLFPLNKPRYGVNKKGYRYYSPKTHRLFTSMNCNFLETHYYYSPQHSGQEEEQGDPLSWLSYTSASTIGNEIQNHSTTSAEAPNISATPEHPVPDMISEEQEEEMPRKELKEEVYMEAPLGFSEHFKPGEACQLKKSLYGLKQSLRAWFGRFTLTVKRYGFKQSNSDHTLFLKNRKNCVTCLIIYVDDMVITRNDEEEIKRLKEGLFIEFEMKDLGNLKYFLGIKVLRSPKGIFICQKKYILDLLVEIGMINCKPADTSMMVNQKLFMENKSKLDNRNRYQRLVGKLIYLSHTRPDIAYAVGVVSRLMHQPQVAHMNAALRIVRYLKGTAGHGVLFRSNRHLNIQMYTDVDWAGDKGNRRSTSGIKEKLEAGIIELPNTRAPEIPTHVEEDSQSRLPMKKSGDGAAAVVVVVLLWLCCCGCGGGAAVVVLCCGGVVVGLWWRCCGGGVVLLLWLLFGSGVVLVNMENYKRRQKLIRTIVYVYNTSMIPGSYVPTRLQLKVNPSFDGLKLNEIDLNNGNDGEKL